jgi:hypothetical protein
MGVASFRWLPQGMSENLWEIVKQSYLLGLTAFGGPPVHFKIVSHTSVEGIERALTFGLVPRQVREEIEVAR